MPAFVDNASSTSVYVVTAVLLVVGLALVLTGRALRKPTPVAAAAPAAKAKRRAPAPPPVGYGIVDGDPDAPPVVVVGAPAAWGGTGPIPVEVHGRREPEPEAPKPPPRSPLLLVVVGALALVVGAGAGAVSVQRLLEKPPTDVQVLLPSTLLGHNQTAAQAASGLLDRAGRAHDERSGAIFGGGLTVLAERVKVDDLARALGKYDSVGTPTPITKGPRGGVARCYALSQGWTCVLLTRSSAVVVTDTNKRSVASAAARARAVQFLVVTPTD